MNLNHTALQQLPPVRLACALAAETGAAVYLVGGAVRDALTGAPYRGDCDFAVAGDAFAPVVSEFTRRIGGHAIPWDRDQTRVVYRDPIGTHVSVDFARCRAGDIATDLALRDFTVNALAIAAAQLAGPCPPDIIDPLDGRKDIAGMIVRMCSPRAFDDDPLRMLRAVRFARQLGFDIDAATLGHAADRHALIKTVSIERVKKELFTVFGLPNPGLSLRQLLDTGLLVDLLPQTAAWRGYRQCPPHQFTLLEHSLRAVGHLDSMLKHSAHPVSPYLSELLEEGVTRRSLLMFSAFMHDSGKPEALQDAGGRRTFHGHDQRGARLNRSVAERLGLGRRCRRMVEAVTANHMRLLHLSRLEAVTERAKLRFLRDCGDVAPEVIMLSLADMLATCSSPVYQPQIDAAAGLGDELLARAFAAAGAPAAEPLLNGADIMNSLSVPPGPQVGMMLKKLHDAEREGLVNSRQEALAWLEARKAIE